MRRRAVSLPELSIAVGLLVIIIGVAISGLKLMGVEARNATETLNQTQSALLLMERIRLELSSIVLNRRQISALHQNNSFWISQPNGSSIQFVTESVKDGNRERSLVYYQAKNPEDTKPGIGLELTKTVYRWNHMGEWQDQILPGQWPAGFIGPVIEQTKISRYLKDQDAWLSSLGKIEDIQWIFQCPPGGESEGRVFFRVKLVLRAAGGSRLLLFTTLVGVSTPDIAAGLSSCPSLFANCFDPARPGQTCTCANDQQGPR
jgi:hypothetical protein